MRPSANRARLLLTKLYVRLAGGQRHNAATLAAAVGVARATVIRAIEQLRRNLARDGAEVVSIRTKRGWHYALRGDERRAKARWRANRRRLAGLIGGTRRTRLKPEDEPIYGD